MAFRPAWDGQRCTLGYQVIDWLEAYACHGPGDVQGEPLDFARDPEVEDFILAAYELDPETGRRVKSRAVYSAPKGRAKSETAGIIAVGEALGPVRFDGWDANGQPKGRPVQSPYIRCLATEEKQSGNTFKNIAFIMGEWGPDMHPDIYGGITGVRDYERATAISIPGGGECVSSSSGATSKDGGKETFLVPDEVHLYVTRELQAMYATAMRNTGKRRLAEPWALLTTTACRLGERSVWEQLLKLWREDKLGDEWLIHHREAKGRIDIHDKARTLRQLRDVYGPAMDPETGWMRDTDVYAIMLNPTECRDEQEAARYYLNRSLAGSDAWIADHIHERQAREAQVQPGEAIAIGFDGSLNDDSTVLRGCRMSDGLLFPLGVWEKPEGPLGAGWSVPRSDVLARIRQVYVEFDVIRGYFDPHEWRSDIDQLHREFGDGRVTPWPTSSDMRMAAALDRLHTGLVTGEVWHTPDPLAQSHYENARVWRKGKYRLVRKETPRSDRKIDIVVGDALALEARADALADGWGAEPEPTRHYQFGF